MLGNKPSSGNVEWNVMINGVSLKFSGMVMNRILVNSTTGREANVCTIEFSALSVAKNDGLNGPKIKLNSKISEFKVGMELIIDIGKFGDKSGLCRVFSGYIESVDVRLEKKGLTTTVIYGMDSKMWMMSSNNTVSFKEKKKYSGVVSEIFNKYRVADAKAAPVVKISGNSGLSQDIHCCGMSEYDFLCRIADLTASMFFVNEYGGLNFIHYSTNAKLKKVLKYSERVISAHFSVSVWGIPENVEVVSWDEKDFTKEIKAKALKSGTVGKGKTADMLSKNVKGKVKIYDSAVGSMENAKARAQAEYDRRVYNLVKNRITLLGSPEYNLSKGITLKNFGEPLDGDYVISEVSHDYNFSLGEFLTTIGLNSTRYNINAK